MTSDMPDSEVATGASPFQGGLREDESTPTDALQSALTPKQRGAHLGTGATRHTGSHTSWLKRSPTPKQRHGTPYSFSGWVSAAEPVKPIQP